MIYAFDTWYSDNKARTVCLGFDDWTSTKTTLEKIAVTEIAEAYISGEFYKRELPCILNLLNQLDLTEKDILVIDGFVFLDDAGKLGLGGHLYEAIQGKIPVIGVAKTNFARIHLQKRAVLRGESHKPLYVTAIGMEIEEAALHILSMAGPFRIPDLLKKLDVLTKTEG